MKIFLNIFFTMLILLYPSLTSARHINLKTEHDYEKLSLDGKPTVARFHAKWCGTCKSISDSFQELTQEATNIDFVDVDIDDFQELAAQERIQGIPAFVFLQDGKVIGKTIGINDPKTFKSYMIGEIASKLGKKIAIKTASTTFSLFLKIIWTLIRNLHHLFGF